MKPSLIPLALVLTALLAAPVLAVPPPAVSPGSAGQPPAATYKVRKGDSLYAIGRRTGLSVPELKRLNGLKGDLLKPGQVLRLEQSKALAATPPPREPRGTPGTLEEVASTWLATPYRFGGNGQGGIDCSNFVRSVFRELSIELPRTAREQYHLGTEVDPGQLQSGDLLFYRTYAKYPSHVGIYLGDQRMIHASPRSRRVVIANIDTPYFRSRFIGARRLSLAGEDLGLVDLARGVEEEPETRLEGEFDAAAADGGN